MSLESVCFIFHKKKKSAILEISGDISNIEASQCAEPIMNHKKRGRTLIYCFW